MKRTIISLCLAGAAFTAACGGSATNSNTNTPANNSVNKMAGTAPNTNASPSVGVNGNTPGTTSTPAATPGNVNAGKPANTANTLTHDKRPGVNEKMRIMRESSNTAPTAPKSSVPAPPLKNN